MANVSLKDLTIAATYDLLLVRNNSWSATGNEISLMNDSGVIQPSGFYIDPTNDRIGIGTATPSLPLDVSGSGEYMAIIQSSHSAATVLKIHNTGSGGTEFGLLSGATSYGSGGPGFYIRDFDNDLNRIAIDPAGKVGIGVNDPAYILDVSGSDEYMAAIQSSHATATVLKIVNTGTGGDPWGLISAADAYSSGGAGFYIRDYSGAGANRIAIDTAGNVTIGAGNLIMADGKGIDFSNDASPAGGMTAELLDDYEEGTFTGTWTGVGSAPDSAATDTMYYTKIGRQVTCWIAFANKDTTGASGQMRITGLPFTASSASNIECPCSTLFAHSVAFDDEKIQTFRVGGGTTQLDSYEIENGATWGAWNQTGGAGKYLKFTVTYFV